MAPDIKNDKVDLILERLEALADQIEFNTDRSLEDKYREALKDAAKTLEATKNAFKSKQLKQLRERIEAVLNEN